MISFNIFGISKIIIQDAAAEWRRPIPPDEALKIMSEIDTYRRNVQAQRTRSV